MKTIILLTFLTAALSTTAAQAMGAGHNAMQSAAERRPASTVIAAASCLAVPVAGTEQRAGGARGSCVVVTRAADSLLAAGTRAHGRTLARSGRSMAPTTLVTQR